MFLFKTEPILTKRGVPSRKRKPAGGDVLIPRSTLYSLFTHSPAAICILRGPDHVYELVNPAYAALIGHRAVLGRPLREVRPEIAQQGFIELLDEVCSTGKPYSAREARVILDRGDGKLEERFFSFVYQPMFADRIIVHAFEVSDEVRARRAAEENSRRLEDLNRAKDDFLATISHELRTPLTSILGWARMLRIGGLDPETTEEALDALERSAQAQVHLIEDLLDDARITSGKLRLNKRSLEIQSIVESAVRDLLPAAEVKRVRITTDLKCESCPINGDPTRLQQVVWNIVANAIKFTPEEGAVSIRLMRENAHANIEVRDTGIGIDPALLPQLFQRFRQGESSSSRKSGIGLGLSISRYLVEQHGGEIKAASEGAGNGATFSVRLPLATVSLKEFIGRDSKRDDELPNLHRARVLIVEDQADNRDVLAAIVEHCGGEARCSSNAADALKELERWQPDVIVCDIALPDMDGCAFLKMVRASTVKRRRETPALAVTVFGSSQEEARIRACGFEAFRQKPIQPADLAHDIARLVPNASS